MFHGKVVIYRNDNGRSHKVEKEFTSIEEYNNFVNNISFDNESNFPKMNMGQWSQFHNYVDNLVDQKLGYYIDDEEDEYMEEEYHEPSGLVDFTKYHQKQDELAIKRMNKLERQLELEEKLQAYKTDLEKLESLKTEFIARDVSSKDEVMKDLEKDIKKAIKAINTLEKELSS